jgi:KH domain-containing protein|tara:strand:- start:452 stop:970 length:519 start_codon:yes stop_codon:yes gene_type:complete
MQEIYVENLKEVLRSKSRLQKELGIKLTNKGKNVFVNGPADKEFVAIEVLEAINLGFSADRALELTQEGFMLQTVHIKDITKRHDLERVRARIIGTHGRTLKTLQNLTNCDLAMNDNEIGLIGPIQEMEDAVQAVTSLVQGSKQGNVYGRLERQRKKKGGDDSELDIEMEKE